MAEQFVTISMRNTVGYEGRYYGPGRAVKVPIGLAKSLNKFVEEPQEAEPVVDPESTNESDLVDVDEGQATAVDEAPSTFIPAPDEAPVDEPEDVDADVKPEESQEPEQEPIDESAEPEGSTTQEETPVDEPVDQTISPDTEPAVLPEDLPGRTALLEAGVTSLEAIKAMDDLTDVPGIGPATAAQIVEYLSQF